MDKKKIILKILKEIGKVFVYIVLGIGMFAMALLGELSKPKKYRRRSGVMCGPGGPRRR